MNVSGTSSVGSGANLKQASPPPPTQTVAPAQTVTAPQNPQISATTTTTATSSTSRASAMFLDQSGLRGALAAMSPQEIALLILDMLLNNENKDEEKDPISDLLSGLGLIGLLADQSQAMSFYSSSSVTTSHTVTTEQVVSAYDPSNTQSQGQAADPSGSAQQSQVPQIDTSG
jgi:hypothetical protein